MLFRSGQQREAALRLPTRNRFGLRYDDTGNIDHNSLSGAAFGIIYGVGSHVLLWNIRNADYVGQLPILRMVYHDLHLSPGYRTGHSKYADPAAAAVSAAHSIHVGPGKTPEDNRNLAVLPCDRNGNIRFGASDLPSRQKKRNTGGNHE